jgi:hypothetical protein
VLRLAPERGAQLEVERLDELDAQRPPRQRVDVAVHEAHLLRLRLRVRVRVRVWARASVPVRDARLLMQESR